MRLNWLWCSELILQNDQHDSLLKFLSLRNVTSVMTTSHYDDVIMTMLASQITILTVVYSIVYSGVNQKNIKAPRHWPLCGKFTGDRWISRTNGQLRGKCFHLMTSSWKYMLRTTGPFISIQPSIVSTVSIKWNYYGTDIMLPIGIICYMETRTSDIVNYFVVDVFNTFSLICWQPSSHPVSGNISVSIVTTVAMRIWPSEPK